MGMLDNPQFYGGLMALGALGKAIQPSLTPRNSLGNLLEVAGAYGQGTLAARGALGQHDVRRLQAEVLKAEAERKKAAQASLTSFLTDATRGMPGAPTVPAEGIPDDDMTVAGLPAVGGSEPMMSQQMAQLLSAMEPDDAIKSIFGLKTGKGVPANILEWQQFQQMSPEEQKQYLLMKRAQPPINLGGSYQYRNPVDPSAPPIAEVPTTLKPGEEPAVRKAQAEAEAIGAGEGKRAVDAPGAAAKTMARADPLTRMEETVDDLLSAPGLDRIVGAQSYIPIVRGTERADAMAKLENLTSQVSQNVLQMYREMSQTGGAVGQVSNFEQRLFQNNLAALDRAQTPEEFRKQLMRIKKFVKESKERMRKVYERTYGQPFPDEPAGSTPPPSTTGGWKIEAVP